MPWRVVFAAATADGANRAAPAFAARRPRCPMNRAKAQGSVHRALSVRPRPSARLLNLQEICTKLRPSAADSLGFSETGWHLAAKSAAKL
jgi:hypothetical protein